MVTVFLILYLAGFAGRSVVGFEKSKHEIDLSGFGLAREIVVRGSVVVLSCERTA